MKKAPEFSLPDQHGNVHALSDYAGNWLVVYFYPKDDTPGCTTQACGIRDEYEEIKQLASVVGISKDSTESHAKFAKKYQLNFPILSDIEHKVIEAYDSWSGAGTERNTFIINPEGQIAKEYRGVTPKDHAEKIISDLKTLRA